MKINNDRLKRLYTEYIKTKMPTSRENCPPVRDLTDFFNPSFLAKKKESIIEHITHCSLCHEEFEIILKIRRDDVSFIKEHNNLSRVINHSSVTSTIIDRLFSRFKKIQIPRFYWKYAFSLLFVSMFIFSSLLIFRPDWAHFPWKKEGRRGDSNIIQLIAPVNTSAVKSSLVFQWNEVKESDFYILELFDASFLPIWKSPKILDNSVFLPNEIIDKLKKNRSYYWMLTCYLPNGAIIESDFKEFILKN